MQIIKMLGLTIMAAMAFSAIAAAGASAEEFIASKTGSLSGKALTNHEFQTGTGAKVVCKKDQVSGTVTELKTTKQALSLALSECTIEGLGTASVSLLDLTLFLPVELSILNPINITASALGIKCEIEIDVQSLVTGHSLSELEYENKSGKLAVKEKVTKIASEIKVSNNTSLCGTVGEKKQGTLTGSVEVELIGGTLEVK